MKMKNLRKAIALFIILVMCFSFSACSSVKKAEVKLGNWDGDTFKNEWSDIQFTLPVGYSRVGDEAFKELIDYGTDTIINGNDNISQDDIDATEGKAFYDCAILLSDGYSNIIIGYETVPFIYNSEDYLEAVKEILLETDVDNMRYTFESSDTITINGNSYDTYTFSMDYEEITIKYTCCARKINKVTVEFFNLSYTDDSKMDIDLFLNSISSVSGDSTKSV